MHVVFIHIPKPTFPEGVAPFRVSTRPPRGVWASGRVLGGMFVLGMFPLGRWMGCSSSPRNCFAVSPFVHACFDVMYDSPGGCLGGIVARGWPFPCQFSPLKGFEKWVIRE